MFKTEKTEVKILKTSEDGNYSEFVIEPLERGFGHTLGNSFRRVLLSMLPGVAATIVKINGVTHEFSTIDGVREDVTEIILNIKDLIVRLQGCDEKIVTVDVTGPCKVVASMFTGGSEITFLNPDHVIATLEENVRFIAEITFNRGTGYVPSEYNRSNLNNNNIGSIAVDSVFTPIIKVNNFVTNTRIGQITDYDKLTLEIWTNGVVTAKEAVSLAASELISHFEYFLKFSDDVRLSNTSPKYQLKTNIDHKNISIDDLELSVRANNSLKRAGLQNLHEIVTMSKDEILNIRNLGKKSFDEVIDKLISYGYKFSDDVNEPPVFNKTRCV